MYSWLTFYHQGNYRGLDNIQYSSHRCFYPIGLTHFGFFFVIYCNVLKILCDASLAVDFGCWQCSLHTCVKTSWTDLQIARGVQFLLTWPVSLHVFWCLFCWNLLFISLLMWLSHHKKCTPIYYAESTESLETMDSCLHLLSLDRAPFHCPFYNSFLILLL